MRLQIHGSAFLVRMRKQLWYLFMQTKAIRIITIAFRLGPYAHKIAKMSLHAHTVAVILKVAYQS